ncbi:hypothetical protein QBC33DRAFT_598757 [Phialemonium atrogriseum]|uniref:Uncharacterized protein n=1 Tax=Phialemonium atrogriseum TaxID=1093897 RepID=A0AAJ0FIE9_9PEZI|nr:uncharacterized protein QBC33DRAFT_598757 [Phialemonium atrogriseum]KAK1763229.1 hypothetical protein QBC33DRAFT_598757 [Phialemonium atrogriseum]
MEMCGLKNGDVRVGQAFEEARNVILQANLTHIEHKLLVDFIEQAASPDLAACEVLKRARCNTGRPIEETLRDFKKDWHSLVATVAHSMPNPVHDPTLRDLVYRRDQSRRCVTSPERRQLAPPEPTFILPPSLARLLGDEDGVPRSLMDAFMTPSGASQVWNKLPDTSAQDMLANIWLLAPGVSYAF